MIYRLLSAALCVCAMFIGSPVQAQDALEHRRVTIATSEGLQLGAFVSRPPGSTGPLPALFLTQWVACGSIAPTPGRLDRDETLALRAGYAFIRVDRAGEGDSEGPGCDKLDYDTEVRHYREAFDQLAKHPWIDPKRIVVYGLSLGSTTAPLVAQGKDVAGVLVQGGGALTYLERMIHFDRSQLERQAQFEPQEIRREMMRRIEFQQHYLLGKMKPEEIVQQYPQLAGVWESLLGTDEKPHYGRPHAWHWQAQEHDWLGAWATIDAPVMVVYGEYDQFEPRHGHRVIVDTVNRLRPGTASWLEIPQAGHNMQIFADPVSAYAWKGGLRKSELYIGPVSTWLKNIAAK